MKTLTKNAARTTRSVYSIHSAPTTFSAPSARQTESAALNLTAAAVLMLVASVLLFGCTNKKSTQKTNAPSAAQNAAHAAQTNNTQTTETGAKHTFTSAAVDRTEKDIPNLCDFFAFPVGAAVRPDQMAESSPYNPLLRHFSAFVAENEMKQESLQRYKGVFTFERADKIVEYAAANGKKMRGHVLVWHNQVPDWFFKGSGENGMATKKELYANMKKHIDTVLTHYKGKIDSWDVVNECIEENGTLRKSKYLQIAGSEEYIENAFRWAREADPNARLFLNDYNIEYKGPKQDGFYDLVKRLLEKGVPIDGVGLQCHISMFFPTVKQIKDSIERFAALGLDVQVTELDVSVYASGTDPEKAAGDELMSKQAYLFDDLFTMFAEQQKAQNLDMVLVWGVSDDCSWLNRYNRKNYPLFFDHNLQAKLAYWVFADKSKVPSRE